MNHSRNKIVPRGPILDNGNKAKKWEELTWEQKYMPIQTKLSFPSIIRKKIAPKVSFRHEEHHISNEKVEKHLESKIREDKVSGDDEETQNPEDIEYFIEDMVGLVKAGGQMRIICKWKDYDESENTNETFENLANSMFMVKKFVREHLKKNAYCVQVVDSENYRWEEKFLDQNLQFIKPSKVVFFDANNDWVGIEWKNTPDITFHKCQEAEVFWIILIFCFFSTFKFLYFK